MLFKKQAMNIIVFLLILLFAYAGSVKLFDYTTFSIQLSKSPLIFDRADQIALVLPISEIIIAFMLLTDKYRLQGLYLSFFTMLTFTLYLLYMVNFSYYIPCSCGGILGRMSWNVHIVFNIFFVAISAIGVIIYKTETIPKHAKQLAV